MTPGSVGSSDTATAANEATAAAKMFARSSRVPRPRGAGDAKHGLAALHRRLRCFFFLSGLWLVSSRSVGYSSVPCLGLLTVRTHTATPERLF